MSDSPLRTSLEADGSLLHIVLNRPKANILDAEMLKALHDEVTALSDQPAVRSILFSGEGKHFSFGASVEEHLPDQVGDMLPSFHALFRELMSSRRVLLAAVGGQCLGGGLELATFCQRVFANPNTKLGQPEIKLGVFAPVASVVFPRRMRQAHADDLLLTGRSVGAEEALTMGLVDVISDDPVAAALAWHQEHLVGLSGAAVRHAVGASRMGLHRAVRDELAELERIYLEELMATHDAKEGIAAFVEKRQPTWTHA